MKKRSFLMFIAFCLFATHLFAQHRHGKHPHHAKYPEMRKEVRDYAKQNILPAVRQQRVKLDELLSKADKETIANVRENLKADRQAFREKREAFHKMRESGNFDHEKVKAEMKPLRDKHKANMDKLKAIAEKYESQIQKLREEIAPQIKTWETDLEKIASQYVKAEELEMVKHHLGKRWRMKGVAFLLLPTEEPKKGNDDQDITQLSPNPANETQQVKVKMKEAGTLRVELYDKQGTRLQTVFEGTKPAGEYTFDVNTTRLSTGNYVYHITTPTGKTTKKMLVRK